MHRFYSAEMIRNYGISDLPVFIFKEVEDLLKVVDMKNNTLKLVFPVSVGDFPEFNVPALCCNDPEKLVKFTYAQKIDDNRKVFIVYDFQISDLNDVLYSGIITTESRKCLTYNCLDKKTSISLTFKSPVTSFEEEGVAPRDLFADVELVYDHINDAEHSFPKANIYNNQIEEESLKYIIKQAFEISTKLHTASEEYDGDNYATYAMFFTDKNHQVHVLGINGEDAFIGPKPLPDNVIEKEVEVTKQKIKSLGINRINKDERLI